MGAGIRPSPWKELELHENGESYEKQILGMWIYFSCDVFHEKSLTKILRAIAILSDGLIPPIDTGLLSLEFEKLYIWISWLLIMLSRWNFQERFLITF